MVWDRVTIFHKLAISFQALIHRNIKKYKVFYVVVEYYFYGKLNSMLDNSRVNL